MEDMAAEEHSKIKEIRRLIANGQKINAIKVIRDMFGCSLKAAKTVADDIQMQFNKTLTDIELLKRSEREWERKLEVLQSVSFGNDACPLCEQYNPNGEDDCEGCPIYEDTGEGVCQGTPFEKAMIHRADFFKYIHAELGYIRSLTRKLQKRIEDGKVDV